MSVAAKATDSDEAIDSEIQPIASEQRDAAKNADNKKAEQKAAMQIGPQDHECRQQKASPRSFQAFSVEYDGEQHGGNIRRNGEIDIWVCGRESGIEQTRRQNGNANCNHRGSAA